MTVPTWPAARKPCIRFVGAPSSARIAGAPAHAIGRNRSARERRPVGGEPGARLSEAFGKIRRRRETGPFSERTLVLSAPEAPIAGREPSRVGSETTQTPCPKSTLAETPVYNLLARRQCDRVGPSACATRHTQCRTSPRSPWFAPDSPLEGAVRCELVSAAGSDSAAYEFLESIKKEGPQPSDALPPFSCNQN